MKAGVAALREPALAGPFRAAFSLVEMMIATIILGFGLLMIGAVLPIAWQGSLEASALTRAVGAGHAAKYYASRKARVDGPRDLFKDNSFNDPLQPSETWLGQTPSPDLGDNTSYSFVGDWDTSDFIDEFPPDGIVDDRNNDGQPDVVPRVHALHLENWAVDSGSRFLPDGLPNTSRDLSVPEVPLLIDYYPPDLSDNRLVGIPAQIALADATITAAGQPVVKLRDRLYPPLPGDLTPEDEQWHELLGTRRYAWGVLHRLARVPTSPAETRTFLMYYVTLRRGSSTSRFARQDYTSRPPFDPPRALPAVEDVLLPVAWRVPLVIVESSGGVPAIAFAGVESGDLNTPGMPPTQPALSASNPPHAVNNSLCNVAELFSRGTLFVDEWNGSVYRVMEREYIPDADQRSDELARLTLDKEVLASELVVDPVSELEFPNNPTSSPLNDTGAKRRNRVVWVYPPPVAAGDRTQGIRFAGPSPAVDIRVEPLTLAP